MQILAAPTRSSLAAAMLLAATLAGVRVASATEPMAAVAMFPVENLSGGAVPVEQIHQFIIGRLAVEGIRVLDAETLDAFMTRHRVRYAAGIDATTAAALHQETGVDGVVIVSVDLSNEIAPPKIGITMRLVSILTAPTVVWADDAGLAGDDAPGWLELGVENEYQKLQARGLASLVHSLVTYLQTGESQLAKAASKFRPRSLYRGQGIEPGRTYSVAVLPFVNLSDRRNAGEIIALLFIRHLASLAQFRVIDLGVTRQELLNARVVMAGGVSISDAELVASLVDADFVLAGRVLSYQDYEGATGTARAEFSTVLIEKRSRRVVFSSDSDNRGDDGVRVFERGTSRTAHVMATQMVSLATRALAGQSK